MTALYPRLNMLFSFHFLRGNEKFNRIVCEIAPYVNVMIDSGAFSNYTAMVKASKEGKSVTPISLAEYTTAIKQNYEGRVWQYVMLDVIGNAEETKKRFYQMMDSGLKPMPVLTMGEDFATMEEFCKYNKRICVAGGVRSSDKYIYQRYQKAFKGSGNKALIHGLGFLRWPDVFQLPIATGDSSTSSAGARFGNLSVYDPKKGYIRCRWQEMLERKKGSEQLLGTILKSNITVETLANPETYRTSAGITSMFEMYSNLKFQQHSVELGFGNFNALSGSLWLYILLSVLSTTRSSGYFDGFDYLEAVKTLKALQAWHNSDFNKVVDFAIATLSKQTNWQVNTIDENQKRPEGRVQ